jgi:hypothetical protein
MNIPFDPLAAHQNSLAALHQQDCSATIFSSQPNGRPVVTRKQQADS